MFYISKSEIAHLAYPADDLVATDSDGPWVFSHRTGRSVENVCFQSTDRLTEASATGSGVASKG
jgi:hypothetical protein